MGLCLQVCQRQVFENIWKSEKNIWIIASEEINLRQGTVMNINTTKTANNLGHKQ